MRANVICPGFVRTPLVDKQIPEQAKQFGISEDDVIKKIMLKDTVDGEFTTVDDIAEVALLFAGFPTNALTGQSLVVSHGWFMQCRARVPPSLAQPHEKARNDENGRHESAEQRDEAAGLTERFAFVQETVPQQERVAAAARRDDAGQHRARARVDEYTRA